MGDHADMMLKGDCCQACGEWLGGAGDGFPVTCTGCLGEENGCADYYDDVRASQQAPEAECIVCEKRFKTEGSAVQHFIAKHVTEFIITVSKETTT